MRSLSALKFVVALSLAASGPRVLAQQPTAAAPSSAMTAKTGKVEVSHVVVESVNGRYLPGADSRTQCQAPLPSNSTSAVIGHVSDPESLEPVAGADVSIAWVEFDVSNETGIRRIPHLLHDSTDAKGSFLFCGLPLSMKATLQARKGPAGTSGIPISLGDGDPELLERTLLLSRADSAANTGNAIVSGTVILEGGAPNAESRVELVGTDMVALTSKKGEFVLTNLPSGTHVLLARHLGYAAATAPVDLSAREPQKVTMKLLKFVPMVDPVLVLARRNAGLDRVGFNERKKAGAGYFLGPEQLQRMHAVSLTDIFRQTRGLRVTYTARGEVVTTTRGMRSFMGGMCVQYFVDDMPWVSRTLGDVNSFVNAREIVAVEVYQAWNAPAQYVRDIGACATVILWTRFKVRDVTDP